MTGDRERLQGPALALAPRLLGAVVVSDIGGVRVALRLTEVEAYEGESDPGSHAFRGRSARNAVMFGPAGHLYVYRHMGLHHCANVVTGTDGTASAVLLRAGEVVEGADLARARRTRRGVVRTDVDLARGPARLADALGLDLGHYGADVLTGGVVELELGAPPGQLSLGEQDVRGPGAQVDADAVAIPQQRQAATDGGLR